MASNETTAFAAWGGRAVIKRRRGSAAANVETGRGCEENAAALRWRGHKGHERALGAVLAKVTLPAG